MVWVLFVLYLFSTNLYYKESIWYCLYLSKMANVISSLLPRPHLLWQPSASPTVSPPLQFFPSSLPSGLHFVGPCGHAQVDDRNRLSCRSHWDEWPYKKSSDLHWYLIETYEQATNRSYLVCPTPFWTNKCVSIRHQYKSDEHDFWPRDFWYGHTSQRALHDERFWWSSGALHGPQNAN